MVDSTSIILSKASKLLTLSRGNLRAKKLTCDWLTITHAFGSMTKAYVAKQMLMGIGRMHTQSSKDFGPEQLGLTQNQGTIQWTLPWPNFGNRQERKNCSCDGNSQHQR